MPATAQQPAPQSAQGPAPRPDERELERFLSALDYPALRKD